MPANSEAVNAFRDNVSHTLERRGITISQMAEDLGMSRPGLSRLLHGHDSVTVQRAERIADYLGVSLSKMLVAKKLSHSS